MLISVKIKNSHAAYNDHSNNISNQHDREGWEFIITINYDKYM